MKKLPAAFFVLISFSLSAQTLFHYGNDSVSVKEFLRAYHKNNTGTKTEKAFRDYLDLYIASKLKIKEAKERGYDTLPQMVSDLQNLRQQILPNYLIDKQAVNRLVDEALVRSQKDIHLAHIFISFQQNGIVDSVAALKKITQIENKLKSGADFSAVAQKYSDDPSAKKNSGDLNWITVFTLPYALENLAYTTPVGKVSIVHQSKVGYHIFKNLGERKDAGKINAAQILIAFPPNAGNETKEAAKKLADSLYLRLQKGDDFGMLATKFSNDIMSATANGQMQQFGVGQYDPTFENAVFALQKEGAYTKPFVTSHGYHIVKLIAKFPAASKTNIKAMDVLRNKVEQSDRMETTKAALANRILKEKDFQPASFDNNDLWMLTDSILNFQKPNHAVQLKPSSTVFQIRNKKFSVTDWTRYAQTFRYKSDGSGMKPYSVLWNEFLQAMALDYYQNHLEQYNEDFRQQMKEFTDGNLFFEIMQREVWGPAQNDSTGLMNYYGKHRTEYVWKQSADAVLFYASDREAAKTFYAELKKNPSSWRTLVSDFSKKIAADSSRFEVSQIPNPTQQALTPGTITLPLVNKADSTTSFAYILRNYNNEQPRNFADAKGVVINGYQSELERNWIVQLQKKYPVTVNEKILKDLIRSKKY